MSAPSSRVRTDYGTGDHRQNGVLTTSSSLVWCNGEASNRGQLVHLGVRFDRPTATVRPRNHDRRFVSRHAKRPARSPRRGSWEHQGGSPVPTVRDPPRATTDTPGTAHSPATGG